MAEKKKCNLLFTVQKLLTAKDNKNLAVFINELQPVDLAEVLTELSPELRLQAYSLLSNELAAEVLNELEPQIVASILQSLRADRVADIFEEMPSDDAADILGRFSEIEKQKLLHMMEVEDAADVQELLVYQDDTAGGLMTTEYVAVRQDISVEQAIEVLREIAPDAETIYYVYAVDVKGQLVGVISLRELIVASPETLINEVMRQNVLSVEVGTDQEEVAKLISKYDFLAIPVVDQDQLLVGIITVDDVIDVLEEEATEDIYKLAGSGEPEDTDRFSSFWQRAVLRLPWLVILLFGELLAAKVIDNFSSVLQAMTILALFITVMAGEAGNAATQSLAVVVRGLATGSIDKKKIWRVVFREAKVGLTVGGICGLLLASIGFLWLHSLPFALTLGTALWINIFVGVVLGSFFPVIIERMGFDPALASGPFITTLTDVVSMAVYFGLAIVFLDIL